MKAVVLVSACLLAGPPLGAHDWHRHEDTQFANLQPLTLAEAELIADEKLAIQEAAAAVPVLFQPASGPAFAPVTLSAANLYAQTFLKFNASVRFWWDTTSFHVESDSIPAHNLMEGISSWQRQIPIPIYYFGTNNWLLPLYPVPTNSPLLITSNTFTRGAIALAANGIPIFNPYNNTGRASALIGELDQFGGHCGRADDYHYHVAPLHLTNVLGLTLPVAFALDGYPIYGLTEPDGAAVSNLDSLQGHTNGTGSYHYHASLSLPYLNAGFHGTVAYVGGQVDPQPPAGGIRPAGTPLAGAFIQIFTNLAPDQFQMYFSVPSNAPPTNYWLYTLNRAAKTVSVTYSPYDLGGGVTTTNYANWKPAPAYTSTNAPLVTVQPTNTTKALGATAIFTLSAAGFGSLAYQWFKDGVEISDGGGISGVNTTTLTIANVQNTDVASYSAVVTNAVGNTLSAAATLTVSASRSISQGRAITITSNL